MSAINEHDKYIASLENRIAKYQAELERLEAIANIAHFIADNRQHFIGYDPFGINKGVLDKLAAALEKK